MVKIERWEKETDEEWAERLAEETAIANDTETTLYFVEDDPYNEDRFIVNYVEKDSMTWKEHPEGPFTCKQVLEWKKKAENLKAIKNKVAEWDSTHMRDHHAAPSILVDLEKILEVEDIG